MAGYPTQLGNVPNRPIPDSSDNEVLNIGPVAFGGLVDGFVMEGSLSQRSVAYTKESQEAMVKETDTIEQFDFNNTTKHFKEFHKILEGESHTIRQESLQRLYDTMSEITKSIHQGKVPSATQDSQFDLGTRNSDTARVSKRARYFWE